MPYETILSTLHFNPDLYFFFGSPNSPDFIDATPVKLHNLSFLEGHHTSTYIFINPRLLEP